MAGGKKANGETKLRFVSDEAQYAVQECSLESGKNPLISYFSKRIIAYICVAIILFMFLTGNISLITNMALKVVNGVISVFSSLS
jgi:hypothetical protein